MRWSICTRGKCESESLHFCYVLCARDDENGQEAKEKGHVRLGTWAMKKDSKVTPSQKGLNESQRKGKSTMNEPFSDGKSSEVTCVCENKTT